MKHKETIDKKLSLIVRNLAPAENGMPVEIYAFCKINQWSPYEEIQSEIFDFVFAVVNSFELKIFQNPSGNDIENIKSNRN